MKTALSALVLGAVALTTVNGRPGAVFFVHGQVVKVVTCSAREGVIDSLFVMLNPDKLRHWPAPGLRRP